MDKKLIANLGLFAGGILFGSAGFKALGSKDAKNAYTQVTAAALRVRDEAMNKATVIRENCDDIYNDALEINEKRAKENAEEVIG